MWNLESEYFATLILTIFGGGEKMAQEEINTYVMGDFSMFREEELKEAHHAGVSKVYD